MTSDLCLFRQTTADYSYNLHSQQKHSITAICTLNIFHKTNFKNDSEGQLVRQGVHTTLS